MGGQLMCPLGIFVAAYGQFFMAANTTVAVVGILAVPRDVSYIAININTESWAGLRNNGGSVSGAEGEDLVMGSLFSDG